MRLQGDQKSGATYLISYIFQHNLYDVLLTKKSVPHYQLFCYLVASATNQSGFLKNMTLFGHSHSFIHSYSFNVQVDITQLQTDREARKEDRIIYICSS